MIKIAAKRPVQWQVKGVEKAKRRIKAELDLIYSDAGPKKRLAHILNCIETLGKDDSHQAGLSRFIYVVSALVHQVNFGGLNEKQIDKLKKLGYALLRTHSIEPVSSQLAFLYAELHLALSQIHWKKGQLWEAAWEQHLSFYLARKSPPGGPEFQALSRGLRTLRLGHASLAIEELAAAERGDLPMPSFVLARLSRIRALRLTMQHAAADQLSKETRAEKQLDDNVELELQWEEHCRAIQTHGDFSHLLTVTGPKHASHRELIYLVEAYMWMAGCPERNWEERLPKMSYLAKSRKTDASKLGHFFECALIIENCYDATIPFATRLLKLGELLSGRFRLVSIDKELLALAAALRWLARAHYFPLATLVLKEYQSLSYRLSNGKCADVLNLVADCIEKPWGVTYDTRDSHIIL